MKEMRWKWGRPPKPEVLEGLSEKAKAVADDVIRPAAPIIAEWIRSRIERGYQVAPDGTEERIPPYSDRYAKLKAKLGLSPWPNYTLTGTLLSSLSGRIRRNQDGLELRISPYGRVAKSQARNRNESPTGEQRPGYYWRDGYTYTAESGKQVTVQGGWIRDPFGSVLKQGKRVVYNAHLINELAKRLGKGKWQEQFRQKSTLLVLSESEFRYIQEQVRKAEQRVSEEALRRFVGL